MTNSPRRGEIWWVNWSVGVGSEQHGRRPSLIIQNDLAHRQSKNTVTIVAAMTSKSSKANPFNIAIEPTKENGLKSTTYVKIQQVAAISYERLDGRLGRLEADLMTQVDQSLKDLLDLS